MPTSGSERGALGVLALLAILGVVDYLLNLAALHFVRPDVNAVLDPVSNYAVGPYGFLFIAALLGSGLGALAVMLGLYLGLAPPARSYIGLLLLGLYGVSELLSAIFPIDVGAEATLSGTIHNVVDTYHSSPSLLPRSSCLWAWVRMSSGVLFGGLLLGCRSRSY